MVYIGGGEGIPGSANIFSGEVALYVSFHNSKNKETFHPTRETLGGLVRYL